MATLITALSIDIKMGHGRSMDVRKETAEKIFVTLTQFLKDVYDSRPLAISFEMTELHPELNFKKNNIHERIKHKNPG